MALSHLSLLSSLSTLFYICLGIIGIGLCIGIHEFGHFFFAKLFKIDVPSFSLGFGPSLFKKKLGGTVFKVSAIPLGGYVEIAGCAEVGQGEQKEASRQDEHSFASKPYYQKMFVMFGGIMFNLLSAYLALILLFSLGIPKSSLLQPLNSTTTIETVQADSSAARANLQSGDTIAKVNGESVDPLKLREKIREYAGGEATFTIIRNGQEMTLPVKLDPISAQTATRGILGVEFAVKEIPAQGVAASVKAGIATTNQLIKATARGLVSLVKTRSTAGVGGPIMIINQITKGAQQGFKIWILLLCAY